MRALGVVLAVALSTRFALAQSVSITAVAGPTASVAGGTFMWVPISFGDSVKAKYDYGPGIAFGGLIEIERPGLLDYAALLTVHFAEPRYGIVSQEPCGDCNGTVFGLAALLGLQRPVTERSRVHVALGPEILYVVEDGTAYQDIALPPHQLELRSHTVLGGLAMVAGSYALSDGRALRLQVHYRYFKLEHKPARPDIPQRPTYGDTPYQQLMVTLGVSWRLR